LPSGRQTFEFDCGPKSLQLVLAYYGFDAREDELMRRLKTDNQGTRIREMISVAASYGFQVVAGENASLKMVKGYINARTPVIVLVQAWADRYMTLADWRKTNDYGHYVVVIGYTDKSILFEDPAHISRCWLSYMELLSRWHDKDPETGRIINRFILALTGLPPAPRMPAHMA
jgi:predicted double-glycine peptidase